MDLTDQRPPKPLGTAFRGSACKDNLTLLNLKGHRCDKVVQCTIDLDVVKIKTLVDVLVDLAHLERTVAMLWDNHALFL